jgi:hypothetical protein
MPNVACPYLRLMGLGCGTILRGLCVGFAQTCSTLHPGSWKTCGAELETMRTAANEWGSQCFTPCSVECCSGGVGLRPFWRLSTQRKRSGAKLANCFEGDLCRVKARALLIERAPDARLKAQPLLEQALAVARSQNARSIELLVARDLADLLSQQGARTQARDLLALIYGWFTEGFETADLKETKALLDEFS